MRQNNTLQHDEIVCITLYLVLDCDPHGPSHVQREPHVHGTKTRPHDGVQQDDRETPEGSLPRETLRC